LHDPLEAPKFRVLCSVRRHGSKEFVALVHHTEEVDPVPLGEERIEDFGAPVEALRSADHEHLEALSVRVRGRIAAV